MQTSIKQKTVDATRLSLAEFLDAKPLYYSEIDYNRMPRAYESIKEHLVIPKIIHIMGTNAKGSTGRFLAQALLAAKKSVGHYSSPHILRFNERMWLNGSDVSDALLESAHLKLQQLLAKEFLETLSYFEYTTFLAMILFEKCEFVVLEAGLGGEHDATSVFCATVSLYTPIGLDHEAFLGSSVKEVATTKLNAMSNVAIVAKQKELEVYDIAHSIAHKKGSTIYTVESLLQSRDYAIVDKLNIAEYLKQNALSAMAILKHLGIGYDIEPFKRLTLFGRLMPLAPNIILDVGHNVLAAEAIKEAIYPHKVVLIYNSFEDKDYEGVLKALKQVILHVELLHVEDSRIVSPQRLKNSLKKLAITCSDFVEIDEEKKYLVFGSFSVAETFIKWYHAR